MQVNTRDCCKSLKKTRVVVAAYKYMFTFFYVCGVYHLTSFIHYKKYEVDYDVSCN